MQHKLVYRTVVMMVLLVQELSSHFSLPRKVFIVLENRKKREEELHMKAICLMLMLAAVAANERTSEEG